MASHQITLNFHFGDEHTEGKVSVKNAESFVDSVTKLAQKIDDLKFNIGNSVIKKKGLFGENERKKTLRMGNLRGRSVDFPLQ